MTELKCIWHTVDKTPEEDRVIVVKSKRTGEYLVGSEFEFILENFTKWAYFDDLLALETELERTRRALDVAKNGLEYIFGYEGVPKYVVKHIRQVLDQIKNATALEQKDK